MIDIVFGVYEDKWCAPLVVLDVAGAKSVSMDFYLPAGLNMSKGVPITLVASGKRQAFQIFRDKLTRIGPVDVGPGGARLAVEFAVAERLPGNDARHVGAVLAKLFADDLEIEIRPPKMPQTGVQGSDPEFKLLAI